MGDPSSGNFDAADVTSLLAAARSALEGAAQHDAAARRRWRAGSSEAAYLLADVAAELASYVQSVEADPVRLAVVQERRAELTRLVRAYGAGQRRCGLARAGLGEGGQRAAGRARQRRGQDRRAGRSRRPSSPRPSPTWRASSPRPGPRRPAGSPQQVTAELTALAMPHAKIMVAVTPAQAFGPHGGDEVEIRLSAHPGAPALPLHKGASGGELSRIMLAIEVVFAGADPVPTFVFDEVDAGVGGKAAVEIGRRLARLARLAQVIVVTHLPQVAAFADTHLVVEKAGDGSVVHSGITRLDRGGPGPRAVPDAGGPGGLRVRPGPCRRAAGGRRRRAG